MPCLELKLNRELTKFIFILYLTKKFAKMKVVIGSVVAALIGAAKADCPEAEITFFGDETCESVLDVPDDAVQAVLDGAVDAM